MKNTLKYLKLSNFDHFIGKIYKCGYIKSDRSYKLRRVNLYTPLVSKYTIN